MLIVAILVAFVVGYESLSDIGVFNERGTFKELVLDEYLNKASGKTFDEISITNHNSRDYERRSSKDITVINDFLSNFNKFQIVETKETSYFKYTIYLSNNDTMENIVIHILGDNLLFVNINHLAIKEDKEKKIKTYKLVDNRHTYKIVNDSIDFNYLNQLFYSLSEDE